MNKKFIAVVLDKTRQIDNQKCTFVCNNVKEIETTIHEVSVDHEIYVFTDKSCNGYPKSEVVDLFCKLANSQSRIEQFDLTDALTIKYTEDTSDIRNDNELINYINRL